MSDYRLQLLYGNTAMADHAQQVQQASVTCPHCNTKGGYVARVHRSWWQRLFFPSRKRFLCMECDKEFWASEKTK
ncbi:MAG: hypothetical protein WAQ53_04855 [Thiofilum sp.]|uniref:hypothetical protein n=1 Tax=Thiofilum sp. TaxID=2212733 RepID=UPI0025EFB7D6|nr:hypothetical protein [Thiofilum sp.]MBK8452924.1 hypothetical protein [Thiofilum sp.]